MHTQKHICTYINDICQFSEACRELFNQKFCAKLSNNYMRSVRLYVYISMVKAFTRTKQTFISIGSNALCLYSPKGEIIYIYTHESEIIFET